MSRITAVLPAFNEEITIGSIVILTKPYVDSILVIDDGSSDRTSDVASIAGADVVRHTVNLGKGAALKTGFSYCNGADVIVTMDTDGQHNPADIPRLVAPILAGKADMVNGSRYIGGSFQGTPIYRRIGQIILDKVTNMNSGIDITDTQSGFRAFSISAIAVFRLEQQGMAIESEMLTDAAKFGLRIKEVEIGVRYDVDGSSMNPILQGIHVFTKMVQQIELERPLYYFALPGLILSSLGTWMGLGFLQDFYHGDSLYFLPILFMIMLILIGTSIFLAGIILHALSKIVQKPVK